MDYSKQPQPTGTKGPVSQLIRPTIRLLTSTTITISLIPLLTNPSPPIPPTLSKVLLLFSAIFTLTAYPLFTQALRSYSLGCSPCATYRHADPLGVDFFIAAVKHLKAGTLLEFYHSCLDTVAPTFTYSALGTTTILTNEPENLRAVLQGKFEDWPIAGPRKEALGAVIGEGSVFQSNGPQWQHGRAMIRPAFVRDQIADLRSFGRHVGNLIVKVKEQIGKGDGTADLQKLFFMMTMDSSSDFILGHCTNLLTAGSPKTLAFNEAFDYALLVAATRTRLGRLTAIIPDKKFDESVATVRGFVAEYVQLAIDEQKAGGFDEEKADRKYIFLTELIKEDAPVDYICDQVLSIFLAGRDTTAAALSALFWQLARRGDVVEKLREEILGVMVGKGEGEMPTWEELKNMRYLQHCLKEILRFVPPVPTNSRDAKQDTVFPRGGGPDGKSPMFVPKGTICRWSSYSLHRNMEYYGDDADVFNPDRWDEIRPTWEYLPFNGGPRICPGQQFALTQMSLVVVKLLTAFKGIEARDDRPMLQKVSTTISLVNGVLVGMVPA